LNNRSSKNFFSLALRVTPFGIQTALCENDGHDGPLGMKDTGFFVSKAEPILQDVRDPKSAALARQSWLGKTHFCARGHTATRREAD
jgi:hypothetical protein